MIEQLQDSQEPWDLKVWFRIQELGYWLCMLHNATIWRFAMALQLSSISTIFCVKAQALCTLQFATTFKTQWSFFLFAIGYKPTCYKDGFQASQINWTPQGWNLCCFQFKVWGSNFWNSS